MDLEVVDILGYFTNGTFCCISTASLINTKYAIACGNIVSDLKKKNKVQEATIESVNLNERSIAGWE